MLVDFVPTDVADKIVDVVRRRPEEGERVRVHMDLNQGRIAVRSMEGETYNQTLVKTPGPVAVTEVEFRVQDSAHESIVEDGIRQVCAYAVGQFVPAGGLARPSRPVRYNPFESKHFVDLTTGDPIYEADALLLWTSTEGSGRMRAVC